MLASRYQIDPEQVSDPLLDSGTGFSPPPPAYSPQVAGKSVFNSLNDSIFSPKNAQTVLYIAGWYIFSLLISIYNKWMFGPGLNFRFPILITSFHQFCLFLLSLTVLYFNPHLRPEPRKPQNFSFTKVFHMNWLVYVKQIVPCSLASAGDIGVLNLLMMFVSLSLYTMLKTSSLMFVLLFGLLFRLEKFHWRLIGIVVVMTFSVMLMVKKDEKSTENSPEGVVLVLFALMMLGLRWSFTQILLKNNPQTPNSIATIFYLSPPMCIVLFIIGIVVEGWGNFASSNVWEIKGVVQTIGLLILPGFLAFMMTLCEFKLLQVSQVTTLSVAGIFKELLTICLSLLIFGDHLSIVNIIGLILTFLDILWYNWFRYSETKKEEAIELRHL